MAPLLFELDALGIRKSLPIASRKNPLEIAFVASPKNPLQMRAQEWW
jgi:hypothetical protein